MRLITDLYERDKRYKIIIVFFIVSIVESLFSGHLFARYDLENMDALESRESTQPQESASGIIQRPKVEYQAGDLRDPFLSYLEKDKTASKEGTEGTELAPPPLTIQGMVWGGSLPQAIINNKVVKVGDIIEDARIVKIDKKGVVVLYGGKEFTISSPAEISRQGIEKKP